MSPTHELLPLTMPESTRKRAAQGGLRCWHSWTQRRKGSSSAWMRGVHRLDLLLFGLAVVSPQWSFISTQPCPSCLLLLLYWGKFMVQKEAGGRKENTWFCSLSGFHIFSSLDEFASSLQVLWLGLSHICLVTGRRLELPFLHTVEWKGLRRT